MVRTKKKASGHAADFKKVKQRVGGRKVAPANETRTEFRSKRINVPQQMQRRPDGVDAGPDLNVADLLSKTQHHNARERRQALEQLRRALQRFHGNVTYAATVTNIIRVVSRLILDDDGGVRRALHGLLRSADFALIASFAADQLHRFVLAAMTHPSMAIRVDGVAALDAIVDVAAGATSGVREQYLSAMVAALTERTETDALGLGKGSLSAALRCCVVLLATDTPAPQTLNPTPNLALLHTPDPFQLPPTPSVPLSADLIEQLAATLIECAIESAGDNAFSLSLCVQGLYACLGPRLPKTICDRVCDHILPLFEAPFADQDLKLQICRLAASLLQSLPDHMTPFLSRSLSSSDLSLQILLLIDNLPLTLTEAFLGALETITPSSAVLDVCRRFFPQFSNDVRERVLNVVSRRFATASSDAITLLLDGVRLYQTPFDALLLLHQMNRVIPADQARIAALFGYVELGTAALAPMASAVSDAAISVTARSLLLDLVLDRALLLPPDAVLSLLLTAAAHCDEMLPSVRSALSRLETQRAGVCSAAFDAIVRLLPTRDDRGQVRRLVSVSAGCMTLASHPERIIEHVWSVWEEAIDRRSCIEIVSAAAIMPEALLAFLRQTTSVDADAFTALLETEALRRCWVPHRKSIEAVLTCLTPSLTDAQRHYVDAEMSIIFGLK